MKTAPKKEKLIGVRLEAAHYARLEAIAKREDRTISAVARRIIGKALAREGKPKRRKVK